jgi:hypothetical protein
MSKARNQQLLLALLAFSFSLAGCSGDSNDDDDGAAGASGSECDVNNGPIDPTAVIDDLEDGNGSLPAIATRNGSWWISTDMTAGTIEPPPDASPPAERILGGRCDSEYAMRVTGSGFTEWGAVLSLGFRYTTAIESIDASSYRGVRFWAKVGENHTSATRVQFQDSSTQPEGGKCNPDSTGTDQCYDGFGTTLTTINDEWQEFQLEFSTLTQREFGFGADALDPATLYDIEWNFDPNATFDLWIDDLWFYE